MSENTGKKKIMIAAIAAAVVLAITAVILILVLNKKDSYRTLKVTDTQGTCYVYRGENEIEAYDKMNLKSGDRIVVPEAGYMRILLDSDKYVYLSENSIIKLEATGTAKDSKTRITVEIGSVVNEVENKLSENSSYEITTPNTNMSIRGTITATNVTFEDLKEAGGAYTDKEDAFSALWVTAYRDSISESQSLSNSNSEASGSSSKDDASDSSDSSSAKEDKNGKTSVTADMSAILDSKAGQRMLGTLEKKGVDVSNVSADDIVKAASDTASSLSANVQQYVERGEVQVAAAIPAVDAEGNVSISLVNQSITAGNGTDLAIPSNVVIGSGAMGSLAEIINKADSQVQDEDISVESGNIEVSGQMLQELTAVLEDTAIGASIDLSAGSIKISVDDAGDDSDAFNSIIEEKGKDNSLLEGDTISVAKISSEASESTGDGSTVQLSGALSNTLSGAVAESQKREEERAGTKVTSTPIPTATNTPVPTATNTPTPTATNTPVPTATNTPTPVPTATNTPTPTATNTPTPTATNTPTPEPTATNTPTPEPTATNTPTPEPTATNTQTPVPTATNTPTPTATSTPTPTNTPTPTSTPTPTVTPTSTPVPTPTPVPVASYNTAVISVGDYAYAMFYENGVSYFEVTNSSDGTTQTVKNGEIYFIYLNESSNVTLSGYGYDINGNVVCEFDIDSWVLIEKTVPTSTPEPTAIPTPEPSPEPLYGMTFSSADLLDPMCDFEKGGELVIDLQDATMNASVNSMEFGTSEYTDGKYKYTKLPATFTRETDTTINMVYEGAIDWEKTYYVKYAGKTSFFKWGEYCSKVPVGVRTAYDEDEEGNTFAYLEQYDRNGDCLAEVMSDSEYGYLYSYFYYEDDFRIVRTTEINKNISETTIQKQKRFEFDSGPVYRLLFSKIVTESDDGIVREEKIYELDEHAHELSISYTKGTYDKNGKGVLVESEQESVTIGEEVLPVRYTYKEYIVDGDSKTLSISRDSMSRYDEGTLVYEKIERYNLIENGYVQETLETDGINITNRIYTIYNDKLGVSEKFANGSLCEGYTHHVGKDDIQEIISSDFNCAIGGEVIAVCPVCNYTVTVEIGPLGHTFENGICSVCHEYDFSYKIIGEEGNEELVISGCNATGFDSYTLRLPTDAVINVGTTKKPEYKSYKVSGISGEAALALNGVTGIKIPASYKVIEKGAFSGTSEINRVNFDAREERINIDKAAFDFSGCDNVTVFYDGSEADFDKNIGLEFVNPASLGKVYLLTIIDGEYNDKALLTRTYRFGLSTSVTSSEVILNDPYGLKQIDTSYELRNSSSGFDYFEKFYVYDNEIVSKTYTFMGYKPDGIDEKPLLTLIESRDNNGFIISKDEHIYILTENKKSIYAHFVNSRVDSNSYYRKTLDANDNVVAMSLISIISNDIAEDGKCVKKYEITDYSVNPDDASQISVSNKSVYNESYNYSGDTITDHRVNAFVYDAHENLMYASFSYDEDGDDEYEIIYTEEADSEGNIYTEHHKLDDQAPSAIDKATCDINGTAYYDCVVCGLKKAVSVSVLAGHVYDNNGVCCDTDIHASLYEDGYCGASKLTYAYSENNAGVTVTGIDSSCRETELVVPAEVFAVEKDGKIVLSDATLGEEGAFYPVTKIAENAFTSPVTIDLSNISVGANTIDGNAFSGANANNQYTLKINEADIATAGCMYYYTYVTVKAVDENNTEKVIATFEPDAAGMKKTEYKDSFKTVTSYYSDASVKDRITEYRRYKVASDGKETLQLVNAYSYAADGDVSVKRTSYYAYTSSYGYEEIEYKFENDNVVIISDCSYRLKKYTLASDGVEGEFVQRKWIYDDQSVFDDQTAFDNINESVSHNLTMETVDYTYAAEGDAIRVNAAHDTLNEGSTYQFTRSMYETWLLVDGERTAYMSEEMVDGSFPVSGHNYVLVSVKTEPGCETEGSGSFKCCICGMTATKAIPMAGHHFENGECKECGETEFSVAYLESRNIYVITGTGNNGEITLPVSYTANFGTEEQPDVRTVEIKGIGAAAFRNNKDITELSIPAEYTYIGAGAFEGATKLLDFSFENRTSPIEIDESAFNNKVTDILTVHYTDKTKDNYETYIGYAWLNLEKVDEFHLRLTVTMSESTNCWLTMITRKGVAEESIREIYYPNATQGEVYSYTTIYGWVDDDNRNYIEITKTYVGETFYTVEYDTELGYQRDGKEFLLRTKYFKKSVEDDSIISQSTDTYVFDDTMTQITFHQRDEIISETESYKYYLSNDTVTQSYHTIDRGTVTDEYGNSTQQIEEQHVSYVGNKAVFLSNIVIYTDASDNSKSYKRTITRDDEGVLVEAKYAYDIEENGNYRYSKSEPANSDGVIEAHTILDGQLPSNIKKATCDTAGTEYYDCLVCGELSATTAEIPAGHVYDANGTCTNTDEHTAEYSGTTCQASKLNYVYSDKDNRKVLVSGSQCSVQTITVPDNVYLIEKDGELIEADPSKGESGTKMTIAGIADGAFTTPVVIDLRYSSRVHEKFVAMDALQGSSTGSNYTIFVTESAAPLVKDRFFAANLMVRTKNASGGVQNVLFVDELSGGAYLKRVFDTDVTVSTKYSYTDDQLVLVYEKTAKSDNTVLEQRDYVLSGSTYTITQKEYSYSDTVKDEITIVYERPYEDIDYNYTVSSYTATRKNKFTSENDGFDGWYTVSVENYDSSSFDSETQTFVPGTKTSFVTSEYAMIDDVLHVYSRYESYDGSKFVVTKYETAEMSGSSQTNLVTEECVDGEVPNANHHLSENYRTITPATCTEDGLGEFTCEVCRAKQNLSLKMNGHTFENGVCKECGALEFVYELKHDEYDNAYLVITGVSEALENAATQSLISNYTFPEEDVYRVSGVINELIAVKEIGENAFLNKAIFSSVTIPCSINSIGSKAFATDNGNASSLTSITIADRISGSAQYLNIATNAFDGVGTGAAGTATVTFAGYSEANTMVLSPLDKDNLLRYDDSAKTALVYTENYDGGDYVVCEKSYNSGRLVRDKETVHKSAGSTLDRADKNDKYEYELSGGVVNLALKTDMINNVEYQMSPDLTEIYSSENKTTGMYTAYEAGKPVSRYITTESGNVTVTVKYSLTEKDEDAVITSRMTQEMVSGSYNKITTEKYTNGEYILENIVYNYNYEEGNGFMNVETETADDTGNIASHSSVGKEGQTVTITKKALCDANGEKEYVCAVCGQTVKEVIPGGHIYDADENCISNDEHTAEYSDGTACNAKGSFNYTLNTEGTGAVLAAADRSEAAKVSGAQIVVPKSTFISGTSYLVVEIGVDAFSNLSNIASVTLPDTVTRIGANAFEAASGLTSINMPTGLVSIGNSAFNSATSLGNLVFPASLQSIGEAAFNGCYGITEVTFNSRSTEIGTSAFGDIESQLTFKVLYSSSAMNYALDNDIATIELTDAEKTTGDETQYGAYKKTYIYSDSKLVKYLDDQAHLFYETANMIFNNVEGEYVLSIMERYNDSFESDPDSPNYDPVFKTEYTYYEDGEHVYIETAYAANEDIIYEKEFDNSGNLINTKYYEDGKVRVVAADSQITTIYDSQISMMNGEKASKYKRVDGGSDAFTVYNYDLSSSEDVMIEKVEYTITQGEEADKSDTTLREKHYDIADNDESKSTLTKAILWYDYNPSSDKPGETSSYSNSVEEVANDEGLISQHNVLGQNRQDITVINMATCDTDGGASYACAICGQTAYKEIPKGHVYNSDGVCSDTDTHKAKYSDDSTCDATIELEYASYEEDGQISAMVTGIVGTLDENHKTVIVPKKAVIDGNVYDVTRICDDVFNDKADLNEITLPDTIKYIDDKAFENSKLSGISLSSLTNLKSIGSRAFYGTSLRSVIIPSGVQSVGDEAFANSDISSVTFKSTNTILGNNVFAETIGTLTVSYYNDETKVYVESYYDGSLSKTDYYSDGKLDYSVDSNGVRTNYDTNGTKVSVVENVEGGIKTTYYESDGDTVDRTETVSGNNKTTVKITVTTNGTEVSNIATTTSSVKVGESWTDTEKLVDTLTKDGETTVSEVSTYYTFADGEAVLVKRDSAEYSGDYVTHKLTDAHGHVLIDEKYEMNSGKLYRSSYAHFYKCMGSGAEDVKIFIDTDDYGGTDYDLISSSRAIAIACIGTMDEAGNSSGGSRLKYYYYDENGKLTTAKFATVCYLSKEAAGMLSPVVSGAWLYVPSNLDITSPTCVSRVDVVEYDSAGNELSISEYDRQKDKLLIVQKAINEDGSQKIYNHGYDSSGNVTSHGYLTHTVNESGLVQEVCAVCGYVHVYEEGTGHEYAATAYNDYHAHTYNSETELTSDTCTVCNHVTNYTAAEAASKGIHNLSGHVLVEGKTYRSCLICGYYDSTQELSEEEASTVHNFDPNHYVEDGNLILKCACGATKAYENGHDSVLYIGDMSADRSTWTSLEDYPDGTISSGAFVTCGSSNCVSDKNPVTASYAYTYYVLDSSGNEISTMKICINEISSVKYYQTGMAPSGYSTDKDYFVFEAAGITKADGSYEESMDIVVVGRLSSSNPNLNHPITGYTFTEAYSVMHGSNISISN